MKILNFLSQLTKGFGGSTADISKPLSDYPFSTRSIDLVDLDFIDIEFFYKKVAVLRRLINFISRETLKEGFQNLDKNKSKYIFEYSMRVLNSLLLFGFVLIKKKDLSILEPKNITFNFQSDKSKRLAWIIYTDGINEETLFLDDLAIGSYEPLAYNTLGDSPLQSLSNDLKSWIHYGNIKETFLWRGGNLRTAIFIASDGYSLKQQDNIRKDLSAELVGTENAGRPLVVFSREGRGNVQKLDGGYSTSDDELFKNLSKSEIADAYSISSRYTNMNQKTSTSQFDFERDDEQLTAMTDYLATTLELLFLELALGDIAINRRFSVVNQKKQNFEIRKQNADIQLMFAEKGVNSNDKKPKGEAGRPNGVPDDVSKKV